MSSEVLKPAVGQAVRFPTNFEAYKIGHKLGTGTFGLSSLWLATCLKTGSKLVMVRKTHIDALTPEDLRSLQYEMELSSQLSHSCIISFHAAFVTRGTIWTVFPLFNYGSCNDVIQAQFQDGLPAQAVGLILQGVVKALEYLHNKAFVHRAVKASHILLNSDGSVCLTGLRYCCSLSAAEESRKAGVVHEFPEHAYQVLPWVAPEVLQQNLAGYNEKSDVYSLGITAVELATGSIPYATMEPTEILYQKLNGMVPQLPDRAVAESEAMSDSNASLHSNSSGFLLSPQHLSSVKKIHNLQQFVDACLLMQPDSRPDAYHLKGCSYLKSVKKRARDKDRHLTFLDLLSPLQPILEFIEDSNREGSHLNLADKVSDVSLDDGWIF